MKIEYKILWLDDKINDFVEDELIEEIELFLKERGFKPNIIYTSSIEDFFSKLNDTYDLIMTDFHMKDMNGDKVVEKIRSDEYSILTEILFYTAQADLRDTNKISRVSFLETNSKTGSHQEVIIEETKKLIELTIRKFQNIVAMRGMIMHETSSLDALMKELVEGFIRSEKNTGIIAEILNPMYENIEKNAKEKYDKATKKKLNDVLKDNVLFSASQKIFVLGVILKKIEKFDFSSDYNKEIIAVRNNFAHAELMISEEGIEYFKSSNGEIKFDSDFCRKIREDITKHENNLNVLKDALIESGILQD